MHWSTGMTVHKAFVCSDRTLVDVRISRAPSSTLSTTSSSWASVIYVWLYTSKVKFSSTCHRLTISVQLETMTTTTKTTTTPKKATTRTGTAKRAGIIIFEYDDSGCAIHVWMVGSPSAIATVAGFIGRRSLFHHVKGACPGYIRQYMYDSNLNHFGTILRELLQRIDALADMAAITASRYSSDDLFSCIPCLKSYMIWHVILIKSTPSVPK